MTIIFPNIKERDAAVFFGITFFVCLKILDDYIAISEAITLSVQLSKLSGFRS